MASDRMRVSSALTTHKSLEEAALSLSCIQDVISSDAKLHDGLMHKMEEKSGKKRDPIYMLNGAINHINEYARLLKQAIDSTEMDWPPKQ